jgi:hypothetical protein
VPGPAAYRHAGRKGAHRPAGWHQVRERARHQHKREEVPLRKIPPCLEKSAALTYGLAACRPTARARGLLHSEAAGMCWPSPTRSAA